MNSLNEGQVRSQKQRLSMQSTQSQSWPPSQNALKHGLRSDAILLPGDDGAEFGRLRHELFATYQPRTRDEAQCVETLAKCQWRTARYQRWQTVFDAQLDALLVGGPGAHVCEPDPHRWLHRSVDCLLQEGRLDRLMTRAREKLFLLQKLRRKNLVVGAIETPATWQSFETPQPPAAEATAALGAEPEGVRCRPPAPDAAAAPRAATPSSDDPSGKYSERIAQPVPAPGFSPFAWVSEAFIVGTVVAPPDAAWLGTAPHAPGGAG
jgi:hypothetical protein